MRRLLTISVFLVLAAAVQLNAQRGGGHGSVGGHGGFSGGGSFGGRSAGGHSFAGAHSASSFAPRSFSRGSFSRGTFSRGSSVRGSFARGASRPQFSSRGLNSRNFNHSRNLRFRSREFRNNCFGFGCGSGYGYPYLYGGIDPYWWWNSDSSYDQDQQDQIGLANEMNAQSLDEQRMRDQGNQDVYARSAPPSHQPERTNPAAATVLVFRDQHQQEIQNYAIVGQTLWNFSPQRTEKIPLSQLDLAATIKANDARGVDFRLPASNQGL
jgi:hypothetical protein